MNNTKNKDTGLYTKSSRYLARFSTKEDLALREAAAKVGLCRTSFVRNAALLMAAKFGCFPEFMDEIENPPPSPWVSES